MGHDRYKIIVGDNLYVAYASDKDYARTLATKLAFANRDEVVTVIDTTTNADAFTLRAPSNCPGCDD